MGCTKTNFISVIAPVIASVIAPPPTTTKIETFREDSTPEQLYSYLQYEGLGEKDREKIKSECIKGVV